MLPILLAMLISPARTIAVILLLHTPRHSVTAGSYVAGMVCSMMAPGRENEFRHDHRAEPQPAGWAALARLR